MDRMKTKRMHDFWRKWGVSVLALAVAVTGGAAIYYYQLANRFQCGLENGYSRAFSQLYADVEELRDGLSKAMVTDDPEELLRLSESVYRMAEGAKQNIGYLPISEDALDATETFLAQVGNYTSYFAHGHMGGTPVTAEETKALAGLYDYAGKMQDSLREIEGRMERGEVMLWDEGKRRPVAATLAQSYGKMEEAFSGYEALTYDAPYSAHLLSPTPVPRAEERTVSAREAMALAKTKLGARAATLFYQGESGGSIPAYVFSGEKGENGQLFVKISKSGGHLLWMMDSRTVTEQKTEVAAAIENGRQYVRKLGMGETEPTFYEAAANTVTVILTPMEEGVLLYPDAIRVRVALDNGEILGVEATDYYMHHGTRSFSGERIPPEESKKVLSPNGDPRDGRVVLFVPSSGRETLAYEWKTNVGEDPFLVYLNAGTGKVEEVYALQEGEFCRMIKKD